MSDVNKLAVYAKSRAFVRSIYLLSSYFPTDERYGLTSQVRRASVSIPANLAEGYGRRQQNDRKRFVEIALGSAAELSCLLMLVEDLELLGSSPDYVRRLEQVRRDLDEIEKMLNGLFASFDR